MTRQKTNIEQAGADLYRELQAQLNKGQLSKEELDAAARQLRIYTDHCTKTSKQAAALAECSVESHGRAIRHCQALGLWPGPAGHIFIIPRKKAATAQLGYKGLVALILRHGRAVCVESVLVYRDEPFRLVRTHRGIEFRHEVLLDRESDELKGVVAIATLPGGHQIYEAMSLREIQEVRRKHGSEEGPWVTHFRQMARKVPITRIVKWLGTSDQLSRAIELMHEMEGSRLEPRNVTPRRTGAPAALLEGAASYVEASAEEPAIETVEAR